MDQEGNIISPLGSFKVAPKPANTSSMSRSSSTTTTRVPTAAVTNSASKVGCLCCPAAPIVPQSTAASKDAVTSCTTRGSAAVSQSAPAVPQPTAAVRAAVTTTTTCRAMMGPTAVRTPDRQVIRVPASEFFRSSGPITAHGLSPCLTGGVRLPRSQQDHNLVSTFETALEEKDKAYTKLTKKHKAAIRDKDIIIARLRSEIEEKDLNSEVQLSQLLWLNTIVNEKEVEIFNKDLAISALEDTVSDQASTINQMQARFISIYTHCRDLAMDRQKKMDNITILLRMEEKAKVITVQQQNLTKSLLALKQKEKKTKFIDGSHSLYYGPTEPSLQVKQEMSLAAARIRKEKEEQDRVDHKNLSDAVDRLARKYDRYNMITHTNVHNTRCDPDGLPCIVPREMMGLWLFADKDVEPTKEEMAMYEYSLQLQVRPPPIFSPNLPRPTVNWNTLNKHKRKNLPDPEIFPVLSVPVDPTFYEDTTKYKPYKLHRSHQSTLGPLSVRISKEECGCAVCVPPFGQRYGFMTDMGVIAMPDTSVHGYKWDDLTANWVIATGG